MSHQSRNAQTKKRTNGRFNNLHLNALRVSLRLGGMVAPTWTDRRMADRFLSPRREMSRKVRFEIRTPATPLTLPDWPYELAVWSWGQGPTILLVHGWEMNHRSLGAFVDPLVERGYRVVAFDNPAHGASGGDWVSIPMIAEAIGAINRIAGPIVGAVAHSMGCPSTALAMAQGLSVAAAVFLGAPAEQEVFVDQAAEMLRLSTRRKHGLKREIQRKVGRPFTHLSFPDVATRMTAPALFFHDPADPIVPLDHGLKTSGAWPNAELRIVENVGHNRIAVDPDVVAEAVDFLDRHAATSAKAS
ncbi:MAG: alpha/beta hydrolase [Deltaproteobacteria bacterium]|nr:alpha/beta hydrolase [Deltaproteobacteria bacterium]